VRVTFVALRRFVGFGLGTQISSTSGDQRAVTELTRSRKGKTHERAAYALG
jgi:hypothetical protein